MSILPRNNLGGFCEGYENILSQHLKDIFSRSPDYLLKQISEIILWD